MVPVGLVVVQLPHENTHHATRYMAPGSCSFWRLHPLFNGLKSVRDTTIALATKDGRATDFPGVRGDGIAGFTVRDANASWILSQKFLRLMNTSLSVRW